jgi:hypothetical protein
MLELLISTNEMHFIIQQMKRAPDHVLKAIIDSGVDPKSEDDDARKHKNPNTAEHILNSFIQHQ